MKMMKLVILIVMIAVALFLILPSLSWAADEGASIYQAKCAACRPADQRRPPPIPRITRDWQGHRCDISAKLPKRDEAGGHYGSASAALPCQMVTSAHTSNQ